MSIIHKSKIMFPIRPPQTRSMTSTCPGTRQCTCGAPTTTCNTWHSAMNSSDPGPCHIHSQMFCTASHSSFKLFFISDENYLIFENYFSVASWLVSSILTFVGRRRGGCGTWDKQELAGTRWTWNNNVAGGGACPGNCISCLIHYLDHINIPRSLPQINKNVCGTEWLATTDTTALRAVMSHCQMIPGIFTIFLWTTINVRIMLY